MEENGNFEKNSQNLNNNNDIKTNASNEAFHSEAKNINQTNFFQNETSSKNPQINNKNESEFNEISLNLIKKENSDNHINNISINSNTNISTAFKSNDKDNEIQIEVNKNKKARKFNSNNRSISPRQKNKKYINNYINKVSKPFFTAKHILLNKYTLKEVNECIYKDYNQLVNILPYYQNYYFQNKINNSRNNNYNNNNYNSDVILICLKYIEYTNFFFNPDITYKVQNLMFNIIKDDRRILEQNKYSFLKNKFNEVYDKLIPFHIRNNYLKAFYDRNPDKNLFFLFKKDLNKINLSKHNDKKTLRYLCEIFEIVKQKMETKKESIKIYLNRLLNANNNNLNSNYNNNIEKIKNDLNEVDVNNHYNNSYNSRKYSYNQFSSSSQKKNISNYKNMNNYMNQINRKNNDINNKEVSLFNINNYNYDNNFKQSYLNRHNNNYFYKNNNYKINNNNDRDYLRNKNYKGELVEIDDINDHEEHNIFNNDEINEEEYGNLKINKIMDCNNEEDSRGNEENHNIHRITINEEEEDGKKIYDEYILKKIECDSNDYYSEDNIDINNLKTCNCLYNFKQDNNDENNNDNKKIKKNNSDTALPRIKYKDIKIIANSGANNLNIINNDNISKNSIQTNKNINISQDNNNFGMNNFESLQLLRLMLVNQNNIMENLNKYIFQVNQMNIMNNNNENTQKIIFNNYNYLNLYNMGIFNQSNINNNFNSYNLYNNNNYNFKNNTSYAINKQEKIIESEYLKLKKMEKENPDEIKKNINLFENHILLQIYNEINNNNNNSKITALYPKIFNKYKNAINYVLESNNLTDVMVEPYGSIVNNFLTKDGDIDISIVPQKMSKDEFIKYLQKIEEKVVEEDKCATKNNSIYINSRYALLSITDIETNIHIDITVHNLLPIYNSKMIRIYSLYDQRFHILGLFLKHWVKINKIKGSPNGYLSSYALLILIIHFLQSVVEPKVLPILQEIKNVNKEYKYYNGEKELTTNIYFEDNFDDIKEYMNVINCGNENSSSTTELLIQFFEYYAYKYNMDNHYWISIKHNKRAKALNCEQIVFPIEDPFDVTHNPGKTLKYNSLQHLEFIFCLKKEINNILSGEYFKNPIF